MVQPDYYETRRANRAQELNQMLSIMASLAPKPESEVDKLAGILKTQALADKAAAQNAAFGSNSAVPPANMLPSGGGMAPSGGFAQAASLLRQPAPGAQAPTVLQPSDMILNAMTVNRDPINRGLTTSESYKLDPMAEATRKGLGEASMGSAKAQRSVDQTAEVVGATTRRFAEWWAKAYDEGGVGNAVKDTWSDLAIRAGGDWGDKYSKKSAIVGLKTEFVARYMPLLTKQGEKDGSVRLVESIFRKVEQTLPKGFSGAKAAYEQLSATMENAIGYSKAFHEAPLSKQDIDNMNDKDFDSYMNTLGKLRARIVFTDEEKKAIDNVRATALEPIQAIIDKKKGKKSGGNKDTSILNKLGLDSSKFEIVR